MSPYPFCVRGLHSLALVATCLLLWGCPEGQNQLIEPQATAAPGGSRIFVFVAEARDPNLGDQTGTDGGAVSSYELGADGYLPGGPPLSSLPLVNPRRLAVHPALPVLYVATRSQIVRLDITDGQLSSPCPEADPVFLSPPCATNPRGLDEPLDMAVGRSEDGTYTLYVAETGQPGNSPDPSRIAAYPLGEAGELPGFPGSRGTGQEVVQFEGVTVAGEFVWGADTSGLRLYRFERDADGSISEPLPTPSPINFATPTPEPTPEPTPDGGDPTPEPTASPEPSPTPAWFQANFPGRVQARMKIDPAPGDPIGVVYATQQGQQRLANWLIDEFGDLPEDPDSSSPTQGLYNAFVISPDRTRIYGALFQDGRLASYALDEQGLIDRSTQTLTVANAASYPTGVAWLEYTPPDGTTEKVVFVSLGGYGRVDGYLVEEDGGLADLPFTSTQPRRDTFPADVALKVLPDR